MGVRAVYGQIQQRIGSSIPQLEFGNHAFFRRRFDRAKNVPSVRDWDYYRCYRARTGLKVAHSRLIFSVYQQQSRSLL